MYIALLLLSVVGFLTAYTIYHEKKVKHGKKIACPLGQDCDDVVRGEYNTFLGIRNEITGMVYYGALIIIFALLAFLDIPMKPLILTVLSAAITASFLFSLYLTVIQLFTIKELCSWCFLSAIVSSIIVILWWSHVSPEFIPFLVEYKRAIVTIHLAGFALGVGGATISDTMFFSFLKDLKISKKRIRSIAYIIPSYLVRTWITCIIRNLVVLRRYSKVYCVNKVYCKNDCSWNTYYKWDSA